MPSKMCESQITNDGYALAVLQYLKHAARDEEKRALYLNVS